MSYINLDWSLVDKRNLIHDLVKIFMFTFSFHLMTIIFYKKEFLNIEFLLTIFAIELGFFLFYVFVEPIIFNNVAERNAKKKN
jgi:uncharacterized membrane protein (DUF485 family)